MSSPAELAPDLDRALDALERRDLDGFITPARKHLAPECEFTSGIGSVVGGGTYRGPDGIRDWFGDLLETSGELHYRDRHYATVGDSVLLLLAKLELTGAASEIPVGSEVGVVYEFGTELVTRIVSYTSHDEARAAAEAVGA